MDPLTLASRLRSIVQSPKAVSDAQPDYRHVRPAQDTAARSADLAATLDGEWRHGERGRWFCIERRADADEDYARVRVGQWAGQLSSSVARLPLLVANAPAAPPLLFFDLETTGLSGGAGTSVFLVGIGWFDEDGAFLSRQYLLTAAVDERALLDAVAHDLRRAGVLVSFNGKSFDAPALEMRYLFHRFEWTPRTMPHLDVLHPARRFWRRPEDGQKGEDFDDARGTWDGACSLTALERRVLGARRQGDVSGSEIPARYFAFVRSGDARPLAGIIEHNRRDLLSLACLTSRLLGLVDRGVDDSTSGSEAAALGRIYARAGLEDHARAAFRRATTCDDDAAARLDALRSLAVLERTSKRHDAAAVYWRNILDTPGCPTSLGREAARALAVHHEHRLRDLPAARDFAMRSLRESSTGWATEVGRRLARLDRKLGERGALLQ